MEPADNAALAGTLRIHALAWPLEVLQASQLQASRVQPKRGLGTAAEQGLSILRLCRWMLLSLSVCMAPDADTSKHQGGSRACKGGKVFR